MAGVLNIKPIITINADGKTEVVAKTFSSAQARKKMIEIVTKEAAGKRHLRFMVAHANAPDTAADLAEQLRRRFERRDIPVTSVSPALGVHAGPGAAAVAFLGE
jgi:hypothetical protein